MAEKVRELLENTELYCCESVEISGKYLYMYFRAYRIKDADRLAEFENSTGEVVSGTVPKLVARMRIGDKLVEYYEIVINDVYGGELYLKRLTQNRASRRHGILYISYHEDAECNYVFFYREKDEFGEADEFDYLVYREMMKEMGKHVKEGAEILYLHPERKYDPVEYMALVEGEGWAKKLMQERG
ncbi:MAG: hypothetical protein JHC25_02350 [Thermodesulfobacterium sp.]|jgi:uncharacterized protein YrzB (UPF0473 family)|nr:hypothetical protein [Thermodesulfobacterium sp.]